MPFSQELNELQEEVKPLWKLRSCPRDFKRTSVERLFREARFALDWCSFRLVSLVQIETVRMTHQKFTRWWLHIVCFRSNRSNRVCSKKARDGDRVRTLDWIYPLQEFPSTRSGDGPDRAKPAFPREVTLKKLSPRSLCLLFCFSYWPLCSARSCAWITRKCKYIYIVVSFVSIRMSLNFFLNIRFLYFPIKSGKRNAVHVNNGDRKNVKWNICHSIRGTCSRNKFQCIAAWGTNISGRGVKSR